jgi:3(or 17)beta-hydroxysteroid dehydrogenase
MGRVEGKVALVTGAASGLGLAASRALAGEGATVIMSDLDADQAAAAAADIPNASGRALDVTLEADWERVMAAVESQHGRLDILLNCAGIVQLASIENTSTELWRKINAVSADGTFFGCKHALALMKRQGSGSIINMSSIASIQGCPEIFAYAAAKSAVRAMTTSIACLSTQEGYGVRCNSIHPGNMDTPMLRTVNETVRREDPVLADQLDNMWVGQPEDIANMVLFLASDESRAVNGAAMVVDNTATLTAGAVPKH